MKQNIKLFLFIYLLFTLSYIFTASGHFANSDGYIRNLVTTSIIQKGELSIPCLDMEGILKGKDDKCYCSWGIGQSLVFIPFHIFALIICKIFPFLSYQGVSELAVTFSNPIITGFLITIFFFFGIKVGYTKKVSFFLSILLAFGTMMWSQSKDDFEHPIEAVGGFCGLYFIAMYLERKKRYLLIIASIVIGISVITRLPSILFFVSSSLYLLFGESKENNRNIDIKGWIIHTAIITLFVFIYLWYNYHRFGSIWETGYQKGSLIATNKYGLPPIFHLNIWNGLKGFFFSPGRSFILYSPLIILFFFSIVPFYKRNKILSVSFLFIIISYIVLYSSYSYWTGGWCWGPRFLSTILPFIVLPIGEILGKMKFRKISIKNALVLLIIIISFAIQISSVLVNYSRWLYKVDKIERVNNKRIDIIYDLRYSPLVQQWVSLKEVVESMLSHKRDYFTFSPELKLDYIIERWVEINVLDFWWVYLWYGGFHFIFIAIIVLIIWALIGISFIRVWNVVKEDIVL